MQLVWRTVVKQEGLWGWRLYDIGDRPHTGWGILAEVKLFLCETKKPIKLWLFHAATDKHKRIFYTEEEAKAWTIAIVRL